MQQLGESGADRELITDQFAAIRDELADFVTAPRSSHQTRMGQAMICRGRTAAHRAARDIVIAAHAGAAVAASTLSHGQSAPAAHVWIEILDSRAQIRAEAPAHRRTRLHRARCCADRIHPRRVAVRSILIDNAAVLVGAAVGSLTYMICGRLPAWIVSHAVLAYANAIADSHDLPAFSDRLHTMILILGAIAVAGRHVQRHKVSGRSRGRPTELLSDDPPPPDDRRADPGTML